MHRHAATVVITVTLTLAIIVPALVLVPGRGPEHGLNGASTSWLLGNLFAAVVASATTLAGRSRVRTRPAEPDPVLSDPSSGVAVTA